MRVDTPKKDLIFAQHIPKARAVTMGSSLQPSRETFHEVLGRRDLAPVQSQELY